MTITLDTPHIVLVEDSDDDHDTVLEAVRQIKADPLLKAISVVVVTTSVNPRDLDFCYPCGANAYHVKPTRYPEHLQMLTGLFDYWLVEVLKPTTHGVAP